MSGLLASKWATAEPISEPVASVKTPQVSSEKQPQKAPTSNGLLRSKWANAPDEHPLNTVSTSPAKPGSPVKSDRHSKKHSPKQHAPSVGDLADSLNKVELGKRKSTSGPRPKQIPHSPQNSFQNSFQNSPSLSSKDSKHIQKHVSKDPPKQIPPKLHSSKHMSPKTTSPSQNARKLSRNFSDEEDERAPMTDAGNVLAAHLGIGHKEAPVPHSRARTETVNRTKQRAEGTMGKYTTPKQKKLNEERAKQEELSREQTEKDAKLKAEVQSLFEKMNDKSTSWADLEDE